jgi:hypothetical protein
MRVTMTTTETVYKRGLDSAPTIARRGKTYDFPADVATALVTAGKATAVDPMPEPKVEPEREPETPAPARRKVTGPSETK